MSARVASAAGAGVVPDDACAALAAGLRVAVGRLSRRIRGQVQGLTASQVSVLVTLDSAGELTLGEIALREGVAAPTATRVVASLVEDGLLERTTDPRDRRSATVDITALGALRLATLRREGNAWLAERLALLSAEDRSVLERAAPLLEALAAAQK